MAAERTICLAMIQCKRHATITLNLPLAHCSSTQVFTRDMSKSPIETVSPLLIQKNEYFCLE